MKRKAVRLLDLGEVPYLRSQTIYHAVANALDDDASDTIILMSPQQPYVCVGYHQDLAMEIDLQYCQTNHLPVLRREVGGGAVYLDRQQLFYHCVFHRQRVPRRVDDCYRLFLRAPVEAYRALGVEARLHATNDILVADRKIGGTGAGTIGEAMVICGSIIFDFDHTTMAQVLRVPSEAFRRQLEHSLRIYMTSLQAELGRDVPRETARDLLVARFAETLDAEIHPGELTAPEWAQIDQLDARFLSHEWLHSISRPPSPVRRVKIKAGVMICEATEQGDGNPVVLTLTLEDGRIIDLELRGNLSLGDSQTQHLKSALIGQLLALPLIDETITSLSFGKNNAGLATIRSCLSSIEQATLKSN